MKTCESVGYRPLPTPLLNPVFATGSRTVFWTRTYWMIPLPHLVFAAFLALSRFGGLVLLAGSIVGIGIESCYLFRLRHRPLIVTNSGTLTFSSLFRKVTIDDPGAAAFYWRRVFGNFAVSRLVIVDLTSSPSRTFRVSGFGVWWPHIPGFTERLVRHGLTQVSGSLELDVV
jgi:hypothetical protein